MFKRGLVICSIMLAVFCASLTGCSSDNAKSKKTSGSSTERPSIMLGDTYVVPARGLTFYCMRVKDEYYMFMLTGSSAKVLSADEPSLFPVLEDGQFARVTADIEETINDFGYVPVITPVSTRIVKLKSSEPVEFDDITGVFNLPSPEDENINPESKLFQYTRDGKLFLILRYKGNVTAYTKAGLFISYEYGTGEDCFKEFFAAL